MAAGARVKRLATALLFVALGGCSSRGDVDIATLASSSDQIIWEAGKKAFDKKQWEAARQHYKRIVDGFPQSEHGPDARIGLADSYFLEGGSASYILAIADYRDFLTLYPSHPKSDYAQFMLAESHFRQRNGPDRDQTQTERALVEYQRVLELYPSSSYAETTRSRIVDCRQSLARAEFLAGYFYQRTRQACRSAMIRYQYLLDEYPDFSGTDEVLFRMSECLVAMARPQEALPQLARLRETFPSSAFLKKAAELEAEALAAAPVAPPAVLEPPSPAAPTPSPTPISSSVP
jgi:outer membrane protein assembly factor BamD